MYVFFFKQKTAYEMRISDWSSDVCSSDLGEPYDHRNDRSQVAGPRQQERGSNQPGAERAIDEAHGAGNFGGGDDRDGDDQGTNDMEIGRASCRERVCQYV